MGRQLPREVIVNTILAGAREASDAYERLSGGYWVDYAPESFLQSSIAFAFDRLKPDSPPFYLTMETSPAKIAADYDLKIDGRSIKMRQTQRFDLLLWYANNTPRSPIEIKKAYLSDACNKDARRMRQWISHSANSIDCGFIVAYTSAKGKNAVMTIRNRFERMAESTKASGFKCISPTDVDSEGNIWDVACFTIT